MKADKGMDPMNVDTQTIVAAVGAVAWLVRLEARITRADERHNDLKMDIQTIKNDVRSILAHSGLTASNSHVTER